MKNNIPGIILKSKFTVPDNQNKKVNFSNYITYLKRKEALLNKTIPTENTEELEYIQKEIDKVEVSLEKEKLENKEENMVETILYLVDLYGVESNEYIKYINYMSRINALKENKKISQLDREELSLLNKEKSKIENSLQPKLNNDLETPEILSGVFSINKNIFYENDIKDVYKIINKAQEMNSILWQDVISFDNDFLEKKGLYDKETKKLSEEKLKMASKKMMNAFIKKENLKNPYWFATIHRNTDNIHIHFSTVEKTPSRPIEEYNGELQPRGKRKQSTIDTMKTSFGIELLSQEERYIKLATLRDQSVRNIRESTEVIEDAFYQSSLNNLMDQLEKELPKDWEKKVQYNHVSYKRVNTKAQKLVNQGINLMRKENTELNDDINLYYETLENLNLELIEAYGVKENPYESLKVRREREIQERLGNAFLKFMSNRKQEKLLVIKKIYPTKNKFKEYTTLEKTIWKLNKKEERKLQYALKKQIRLEKEDAIQQYEEMQKAIKQSLWEQNQTEI